MGQHEVMATTPSMEKRIQIALARRHRVKKMQIASVMMHILLERTQKVNDLNDSILLCHLSPVADPSIDEVETF